MHARTFGKRPSGARLQRMMQSPNYKKGSFQNLSPTPVMAEDASFWKTLKDFLNKPKNVRPDKPLPVVETDLHHLPNEAPVIVWFGHSSYFLQINGKKILVDPVFGKNASPIPFMIKPFAGTNVFSIANFPDLDMVILTHDHYDHLDYATMLQVKHKTTHFYTTLGVGSHLEYWGVSPENITEFDWWESKQIDEDIMLSAAPGRHFSGRGLKRGETLWASFILRSGGYNLYLGGDSGYDSHFKKIGEEYGPFDLAILECGQYNKNWPHIHMMPEETAQAAVDLQAKVLLPVHWGKFDLALHPWDEPIKRLVKRAAELNLPIITPMIGEPVQIGKDFPEKQWWINS